MGMIAAWKMYLCFYRIAEVRLGLKRASKILKAGSELRLGVKMA
jgi:hypothetical protein